MSQMSQICGLYRFLFRRSANIYVSKLRFAVVWLGQIHNLDWPRLRSMFEIRLGTTDNKISRILEGWAEYFFPTPMPKPPRGPWGPTHLPPTPFRKDSFFSNFGAKFKYTEPKFKYMVTKFKYIAPKLKCVAPKLKYLTPNSNNWIFVPPKTSRFVRGKLPAPPVWHPPTTPSVLVKT